MIQGDWHKWIAWAIQNHFVVVNDPPTWGCIARPVSRSLYETVDKSDLLYCFDREGDFLYVDFLWAPHQWHLFREFLISTGKPFAAWEHRETGRMHTIDLVRLCERSRKGKLGSPDGNSHEIKNGRGSNGNSRGSEIELCDTLHIAKDRKS
jgi:hypothetical protein